MENKVAAAALAARESQERLEAEIRAAYAAGLSLRKIGVLASVSYETVRRIVLAG